MEPVTLTTERLLIDSFVPGDVEAVYASCQDPEIQRWTTIPSPYERQHAEWFVNEMVPESWDSGTGYHLAVRLRESGPVIGAIGLHHPREGGWEIGFWIDGAHRGRGYMTEAVHRLAHWAFTELGCTRLEWRAQTGNTASRTVAEKTGFTVEGVLRAGMLSNGTVRDCWVGALLPSDLGLPTPLPYLATRD
ncbi:MULTISPECIES: GNAT family N-acetyltransferase [Streptomyces]|uniref:GNAT family N-acetyltransferase n=1 Tax=Streptomyces solicathayae TaxID=3081768 RepID=A0ABZ0LXB0_9ACTN|nr:GNAT family N-acetyltransferase [Streptomyces sp. HUAS YS2]WOX24061.1 GNAT family N-acetyltransferase [Streptomyces sp. HUAS YS2]